MAESSSGEAYSPLIPKVVYGLGLILKNTVDHAWFSDTDARDTTKNYFDMLTETLNEVPSVAFTTVENSLSSNGRTIELKNDMMKFFVNQFAQHEVGRLVISKGLSFEEFENLIELLASPKSVIDERGGFAEAVEETGSKSVKAKKVRYREVTEDEMVINKGAVEKATEMHGEEGVKKILNFLKGETSSEDKLLLKFMQDAATDTSVMTQAIKEAVAESKDGAPGDSDDIGKEVVESLRKIYSGLMKDPAVKTQKGKKQISKILSKLEKDILENKDGAFGDLGDEATKNIADAVADMNDELKIHSVASEYMKKLEAIRASEERVMRLIKMKGLKALDEGQLSERLIDGGLDEDVLHQLLVKTGLGKITTSDMEAVDQLEVLLGHIESELDTGDLEETRKKYQTKIAEKLTQVTSEVDFAVAATQRKINDFVQEVYADQELAEMAEQLVAKEKRPQGMTRRKMLTVLAEIVQELCQPLAVINCSLQLLTSKYLGEINEAQVETIDMATDSAAKIKTLIDNLMEISGLPTTMSPDEGIQTSLYDGSGPGA